MTAPTIYPSAAGLFRITDDPGVWPHRGQVAAVGVGHSPTLRRWDGDPQKSIGAWAILAIRRAIEDAGVEPRRGGRARVRLVDHHRRVLAGG